MILSVSRRTDIPAFYTEWFFYRLHEGYVLVRNPINYHQVSKVSLSPDIIDCIVFWTKDPTKMLEKLHLLKSYKYYFQITINPYDKKIERNVPNKNKIIESFKKLSDEIGKEKVIWRYDPIIITEDLDMEYHYKYFNILASKLAGYTERCIISFIDIYQKIERNMKSIIYHDINKDTMLIIGGNLSEIGRKYNIKIETCSEMIDLSSVGIEHSKCVDGRLISRIIGQSLDISKDKNQRDICGCVTSVDIGSYNNCKHGCLYCYANLSDRTMVNNIKKHDKNSPMLIGNIEPEDVIADRKMELYALSQISFFEKY